MGREAQASLEIVETQEILAVAGAEERVAVVDFPHPRLLHVPTQQMLGTGEVVLAPLEELAEPFPLIKLMLIPLMETQDHLEMLELLDLVAILVVQDKPVRQALA